MFANTPFATIAKSVAPFVPNLSLSSVQEAFKPVQENVQAWVDLAQNQVALTQAFMVESVDAFQGARDPQAFFEAYQTVLIAALNLSQQNLKGSMALSVLQFQDFVDVVQKANPAAELFAPLAQCLKSVASYTESAINTSLEGTALAASVSPVARSKRPTK